MTDLKPKPPKKILVEFTEHEAEDIVQVLSSRALYLKTANAPKRFQFSNQFHATWLERLATRILLAVNPTATRLPNGTQINKEDKS